MLNCLLNYFQLYSNGSQVIPILWHMILKWLLLPEFYLYVEIVLFHLCVIFVQVSYFTILGVCLVIGNMKLPWHICIYMYIYLYIYICKSWHKCNLARMNLINSILLYWYKRTCLYRSIRLYVFRVYLHGFAFV